MKLDAPRSRPLTPETLASQTKRKAPTPAPNRRPPDEAEAKAIKTACQATNSRARRATVAVEAGNIAAPHSDHAGWTNQLADTFGSTSNEFLSAATHQLEHMSRRRGAEFLTDPVALNAALAMVAAVDPENELEAAMAVQMAGCHALAAEMLGRAKQTDRTDHIQLYGGLAVKLLNTFAAQMTALAKLRGGGRQQVEVRHVYVNGNAVIGDGAQAVFGDPQGGGSGRENRHRPHAQGLEHLPGELCPEVRGQDAERVAVSVAGGEGAEAVSDARRD